MNLEQLKKESRGKYDELNKQDNVNIYELTDHITTTSYQAGALAVIEKVREVSPMHAEFCEAKGEQYKPCCACLFSKLLTTLEAKLKDQP